MRLVYTLVLVAMFYHRSWWRIMPVGQKFVHLQQPVSQQTRDPRIEYGPDIVLSDNADNEEYDGDSA